MAVLVLCVRAQAKGPALYPKSYPRSVKSYSSWIELEELDTTGDTCHCSLLLTVTPSRVMPDASTLIAGKVCTHQTQVLTQPKEVLIQQVCQHLQKVVLTHVNSS